MRPRAPFIALLVTAACLMASLATAGAWLPARGEYYSEISAGRSFVDTYYDSLGVRYVIPFSQRLEQRSLQFYNEFGWKKRVSLILSAPILSDTYNVPDFGYERTETGLGDLNLGFRFKLREGSSALALQTNWIAPLGYQARTFPALGSGKQIAMEQLLFGTGFKRWNAFVEASVAYASFFEPIRSRVSGSALVGWWSGSSLLVTGHYSNTRVLGGSARAFDDIGVQVVGPELRYRVDDRLDVFAGSNHIASGRNVNHSDGYYVGMAFRQTKLNRLQGLLGNKTRP